MGFELHKRMITKPPPDLESLAIVGYMTMKVKDKWDLTPEEGVRMLASRVVVHLKPNELSTGPRVLPDLVGATVQSAAQWAKEINIQIGKSVAAIVEVGQLLVEAKADLAHGEWGRMFDDGLVPFSQNTAGQLMKIAEHHQLSNPVHAQNLPPAWTSLYELTKVEPKRLTAAFKDGLITPDMTRSQVKALQPPVVYRPPVSRRPPVEPEPTAKEYEGAFLVMANRIVEIAENGPHSCPALRRLDREEITGSWYRGPITEDVVRMARLVVTTWTALAESLEGKLQ